ncbi:hypothetical protein BG006_001286 [Podila minutissima]|uniref:AMP-dependent synthetase/ligase domain-containing protein n=1 Tax=Podila minutissima TaxID=64525 RepID=A0A9P5SAH9_9FUNG|nr:hypothetical protein BG006_001286 [Podila minutissima]
MVSPTCALALISAGLYLDGRVRLSRDLAFGISGLRTKLWFEKQLLPNNDVGLYNRFDDQVQIRPYAIALAFVNHPRGIQPKDRVAMIMTNSPLFVISWLALLKIKAVAAFINNQITGPVLLLSLNTANSLLLVFDYELIAALHEPIDGIRKTGYRLFTVTPKDQVLPRDAVALIYTSGTTGFPKAAVMDHGRCTSGISKITEKDRTYDCLPLYHSAGDQEVSMVLYIGELCRYLVNAPENARDKDHKVWLMFDNGMRTDVWRRFRGPLVRTFQPGLRIVKADLDTEELIKDKNGYCIECDYGETGELITLADNKTSQSRYIGYYNQPKLSNAKLIQNAFEEGDTFRWKGENMSTAEVADTLGHVHGVTSCTVYGDSPIKQEELDESENLAIRLVKRKGGPGLVDRLGRHAAKRLPSHAIPRFFRICEGELEITGKLEITGTFKNKKVELRKEGFDLGKVRERLYWWTPQGCYQRFGARENEVILAGRARL